MVSNGQMDTYGGYWYIDRKKIRMEQNHVVNFMLITNLRFWLHSAFVPYRL